MAKKQIKFEHFFDEENLEMIAKKCELLMKHHITYNQYLKNPQHLKNPQPELEDQTIKAPSEKYYSRIFTKHFPALEDVLENWWTLSEKQKKHFRYVSKEVVDIFTEQFGRKPEFILNTFWK